MRGRLVVRGWFVAVLVGVLAAVFGPVPVRSAVAAEPSDCAESTRVFGVRPADGHLIELGVCLSAPAFTSGVEVDGGDWHRLRPMASTVDGQAAVLYSVSSDGHLEWRRQEAAGQPFGPPSPLTLPDVDPAGIGSLVVPQPGYLHTQTGASVRTFRHTDWTTGGPDLVEVQPLPVGSTMLPPLAAVRWGSHAVVKVGPAQAPTVVRLFAGAGGIGGGRLPASVRFIAGADPWLFGLDADGAIVLLRQSPTGAAGGCENCYITPWQLAATTAAFADGPFSRVVVPVDHTGSPTPTLRSAPPTNLCHKTGVCPWEWLSYDV
ncbi:hypothetical protein GCM10009558_007760 [Virgisporangium aurantiacum]